MLLAPHAHVASANTRERESERARARETERGDEGGRALYSEGSRAPVDNVFVSHRGLFHTNHRLSQESQAAGAHGRVLFNNVGAFHRLRP